MSSSGRCARPLPPTAHYSPKCPRAHCTRTRRSFQVSGRQLHGVVPHRGVAIPGLPFDDTLGTVPHTGGRVLDGAAMLPGLYVTGWLKRGPTGIIGTNRADSVETVKSLLADLSKGCDREKRGAEAVGELLERRGVRVFDYQNWSMLDRAEISRGKPKGKPREKFTRIDEMLAASTGRGNEDGHTSDRS